ncbi:hypothetical protein VQH23_05955 [Pararoseomonas sp. SCSIO 73927]|uniref:hypothetical protein n=1 Tax=Pararoseomonas sp. SCSIO 73927 TaxID=3114537 RepID=UPI0030CEE953
MDALPGPPAAPRLTEPGFGVVANTPAGFATFRAEEIVRWKRVVQTGNIKVG